MNTFVKHQSVLILNFVFYILNHFTVEHIGNRMYVTSNCYIILLLNILVTECMLPVIAMLHCFLIY